MLKRAWQGRSCNPLQNLWSGPILKHQGLRRVPCARSPPVIQTPPQMSSPWSHVADLDTSAPLGPCQRKVPRCYLPPPNRVAPSASARLACPAGRHLWPRPRRRKERKSKISKSIKWAAVEQTSVFKNSSSPLSQGALISADFRLSFCSTSMGCRSGRSEPLAPPKIDTAKPSSLALPGSSTTTTPSGHLPARAASTYSSTRASGYTVSRPPSAWGGWWRLTATWWSSSGRPSNCAPARSPDQVKQKLCQAKRQEVQSKSEPHAFVLPSCAALIFALFL